MSGGRNVSPGLFLGGANHPDVVVYLKRIDDAPSIATFPYRQSGYTRAPRLTFFFASKAQPVAGGGGWGRTGGHRRGRDVRTGINSLTAALLVGVAIGLVLTPDGRAWLRHPTLMLGSRANASAVAPEPASPALVVASTAPTVPAVTPLKDRFAKGTLRIGVFGDSMADGLWAGLYREMHDTPGVTVTQFSEVSTGLSRYDYVDIQAKTTRQLAEHPVDVAVVLFGTNDAQGISLDGQVHAFGTEGWKAAYGKRVEDLVVLLRSRDVAVYWVGLPRMKRASFDARMTLINAVVAERMAALNVPYLSTVALTSDADGDYDAYLATGEGGRRQLMRANDGIHMSMAGYLRITEPVAQRLRHDAGMVEAAAPGAATPVAATPVAGGAGA